MQDSRAPSPSATSDDIVAPFVAPARRSVVTRARSRALPVAFAAFVVTLGSSAAGLVNAPADVRTGAAAAWSDSTSPVPVASTDANWGARDAPVTIVVFSDFQCPFCSRVEPTLEQIKTLYGPHTVRLVWKNNPLPFHVNARPAAEAAAGVLALAGNDAFWKFHDLAFQNQSSLSPSSYESWAVAAGVTDVAAFRAGMTAHSWARRVDADLEVGKKAGITGTPGFMINGVGVSGAQPLEKFQAVIDAELAKANAKLAEGTPRDRVYVAMSLENFQSRPVPTPNPTDDTATVFKVPIGGAPQLGRPDALVTIIVFSDFQCPFCARVEPTLSSLRAKYGDKLRIVFRNNPLPFHPRAEPAAELVLEARAEHGEPGFWAAHDKLFTHQRDLSDAALDKLSEELGLDVMTVKNAIVSHKYKQAIDEDIDLGERFGVKGTPHMFINGRRLVGAQPEEKFTAIIEEELTKAEALVRRGTPRAQIYALITQDGKPAQLPPARERKQLATMPAGEPSKGAPGAKVVIHEFGDFECPFCSREEPVIVELLQSYAGKVRLVWHDLPLPMHANAELAAEAAREAYSQKGAAGFWSMHDMFFAHQQELTRTDLEGYARSQGLDITRFTTALDTGSHRAEVAASKAAADATGVNGTPGFVINGYFINGAQPAASFRKVIDLAIQESK